MPVQPLDTLAEIVAALNAAAYLDRWAHGLGVADLLEQARRAAQSGGSTQ